MFLGSTFKICKCTALYSYVEKQEFLQFVPNRINDSVIGIEWNVTYPFLLGWNWYFVNIMIWCWKWSLVFEGVKMNKWSAITLVWNLPIWTFLFKWKRKQRPKSERHELIMIWRQNTLRHLIANANNGCFVPLLLDLCSLKTIIRVHNPLMLLITEWGIRGLNQGMVFVSHNHIVPCICLKCKALLSACPHEVHEDSSR